MSTSQRGVSFDPRPLTDPVDRAAAREFVRRLRSEGRAPGLLSNAGVVIGVVVGVVVALVFGAVFLAIIPSVIGSFFAPGGFEPFGLLFLVFPLLIVGILVLIVITTVRRFLGGEAAWYRLDRFARANGMTFIPTYDNPPLPGMIFGSGGSRAAHDIVRGEQPRFVEFGNYRYTTGSGKERTTHEWGYVAVKLDVPLPNIVLDAVGNNGFFGATNLPAGFDKGQRLSLEGDFDTYFALYCPEGYERDALYLFTPDIMARFIDSAAALDVEIVDDWLFLYGQRRFSTLDPHTWAWLFSVVGALNDKLAQWSRWRDERLEADPLTPAPTTSGIGNQDAAASPLPFVTPMQTLTPPPGVAPAGRRLTRRVPWGGIVVLVVFVAIWLFMQFDGFASLLR